MQVYSLCTGKIITLAFMNQEGRKKQFEILNMGSKTIQWLFWIIAFLFFVFFYGRYNQDYQNTIVFCLCLFPLAYLITWFFNQILVPKYLLKRHFFKFILFSCYTFILSLWIEVFLVTLLFVLVWNYSTANMDPATFDVRFLIVGLYFVIIGGIALNLIQRSIGFQRQKEQNEKRRVETDLRLKETELNMLKSQVNPHFLFNSLNCIYGLSLEKSDETPEVIMRLSEMLDYMLYRCNDAFSSIQDEIKLIKNYVGIQQIRYGKYLDVQFKEDANNGGKLAPLLLLPLIENAFKHGGRNSNNIMELSIETGMAEQFYFRITNSVNPMINEDENIQGGIGLENLRRRMELIYPGNYELHFDSGANYFTVDLKISV
ncbi:histidine kinase [Marinilabiliaceae bacterium JC017]|nr:histidine kinase [Marinilabiliaceae bacterium JC017]